MRIASGLLLLFAVGCDRPASPPPPSPSVPFADKLLARASGSAEGVRGVTPVISPDGESAAFVIQGRESFVIHGETRSEVFDRVRDASFSPDGKSMSFLANKGQEIYVVISGKKEGPFAWAGQAVFSPDGRRVAYGAGEQSKAFVVLDGKRSESFDSIGEMAFNSGGTSFGFIGKIGEDAFVVVDGKRSEACQSVEELRMVGSEPVYVADRKGVRAVFKGSTCIEEVRQAGDLRISENGRVYAYCAHKTKLAHVAVGEKKSEEFDEVGPPVLSRDGARFAFSARSGQKWLLVVDGRRVEEEGFYRDGMPSFSPDGKIFAYVAGKLTEKKLMHAVPVIDGVKGEEFSDLLGPVQFAPDGRTPAFVALTGLRSSVLVVGGKKIDLQYWPIADARGVFIHFSPDGSKVAVFEAQGQEIWRRAFDTR